tara:strand:- start:47 stop:1696 length:1650 start_codon:yes stop_codon:yes gene_type:complete
MSDIDTDIDSYSLNELKGLLNINSNINSNTNFTRDILDQNYNIKLQQLQELTDPELKQSLNSFFTNVYNFLCFYCASNINNNNNTNTNNSNNSNSNSNNSNSNNTNKSIELNNMLTSELVNKIDRIENNLENKLSNIIQENSKSRENIYSFNQVNESNYPLNPKTYNTIKKQISINSEFKKPSTGTALSKTTNCGIQLTEMQSYDKTATSTNFIVELPEAINNVISLELVNSEIPSLIYTFSERKDNNRFIISMDVSGLAYDVSYAITIPSGVWYATDIESHLSEFYLDTEYSDLSQNYYLRYLKFEVPTWSAKPIFRFKTEDEIDEHITNYPSSDLSYNSISSVNLKYCIYNVNDPYICINNEKSFSIYKESQQDEINFSLSCLGTMGFTLQDTYDYDTGQYIKIGFNDTSYQKTIGIYSYNGYLQAKHVYGHSSESSYYIAVNDFVGSQTQQLLLLGYQGTLTADNILSRIQITSSPFQSNTYSALQDYSIKRTYHGGVKIRKLHIQVLDKYGRIIDLQDYPTNFVFEFTTEYSSEKLALFRKNLNM